MVDKKDFDKIKSKYITTSKIQDIRNDPIVEVVISAMETIPGWGAIVATAKSSVDEIIKTKMKNNVMELFECILNGSDITSDCVNDVDFIFNLCKSCDVVRRLTTNDKIRFFGNLLRNGYLAGSKIDNNVYDECFERINGMSYREISWLWKYYEFCNGDFSDYKKWYEFKRKLSCDERVDEELVADIFASLVRTGLIKQVNVMFPDGQNENPYILTELFFRFANYTMKE